MKEPPKPITFTAHVPNTQTAIQFHGGGGMRMQLEIPDDQLGNTVRIIEMRDWELKVTIEAMPKKTYGMGQKAFHQANT